MSESSAMAVEDLSVLASSSDQEEGNVVDDMSDEVLILHVDVGQGEAQILLERSAGKPGWCCIIDGGFATAGRGALIRYLTQLEVTIVDLMVCTHFDGDHTKGLTDLLLTHAAASEDDAKVGAPYVRTLLVRNRDKNQSKSNTKLKLLGAATKKNVAIAQAAAGAIATPRARSVVTCVFSDATALQDENDGSIALVFQFGKFRYYTAGDLPSGIELTILGAIGEIDAFKCGHHGSANSTPDALLTTCNPIVAYISTGRNSFGHPTFDIVERLAAIASPVQTFYMTNCIHNRRCVNEHYSLEEASVMEAFFALDAMGKLDSMDALDPELFVSDDTYDFDVIQGWIDTVDEKLAIEADEEQRKLLAHRRRILRGMQRTAQHETRDGLKEATTGRVGGGDRYLGTIVTHVPYKDPDEDGAALFHVGYMGDHDDDQSDMFAWYRHRRGEAPRIVDDDTPWDDTLDDLIGPLTAILGRPPVDVVNARNDFVSTHQSLSSMQGDFMTNLLQRIKENIAAQNRVQQPLQQEEKKDNDDEEQIPENPDYALLPIPDSPRDYSDLIADRYANYERFSRPTVVGLSAKDDGRVYIPFCAICDTDFDAGGVDVELLEVRDEGEPSSVHMHRMCARALSGKLDLEMWNEQDEAWADLEDAEVNDAPELVVKGLAAIAWKGLNDTWPGSSGKRNRRRHRASGPRRTGSWPSSAPWNSRRSRATPTPTTLIDHAHLSSRRPHAPADRFAASCAGVPRRCFRACITAASAGRSGNDAAVRVALGTGATRQRGELLEALAQKLQVIGCAGSTVASLLGTAVAGSLTPRDASPALPRLSAESPKDTAVRVELPAAGELRGLGVAAVRFTRCYDLRSRTALVRSTWHRKERAQDQKAPRWRVNASRYALPKRNRRVDRVRLLRGSH